MAKYIKFELLPKIEGHKTDRWSVQTNEGIEIGTIKWYNSWRSYAFHPEPNTIFESICLHDIAEFLEEQMEKRFYSKLLKEVS